MKKTHIIAIVFIAVAIAFMIGSVNDSSSYADFDEAFENPQKEYHVVGELDRSAEIAYNPEINPNITEFTMVDKKGERRKVILNKSKPQDFERSESVVLIGKANEHHRVHHGGQKGRAPKGDFEQVKATRF